MPDKESLQNAPMELAVEEARETPRAPEPTATGTDAVAIYNHRFSLAARDSRGTLFPGHIALAVGNETNATIATIVFEAVFFDEEGNIVDKTRYRELTLPANRSRALRIPTALRDYNPPKSYAVRVIRTSTADFEPIQLRRRQVKTTEDGQEQVSGTVINISDAKTGAAVIASFYDVNEENIGISVLPLLDIEPDSVRSFEFKFKPQEGERVSRCTIQVGRIAG